MNNQNKWSQKEWSWREGGILLFIVLVIIPIFVEGYLQRLIEQLLQNSLYGGTLIGAIMAIVFVLCTYFIALKPYKLRWASIGLRGFPLSYWKWIILWLMVLIVLSIGILLLMDLLQISWENNKTEALKTDVNGTTILIGFISAAIISPIYEEIFYRGFLYKWLRIKYGVAISLLVSSFIFMIVHIPTYNTLPITFLSGLIFACTYEKTSSIIPAIMIHAAFNGIAILMTLIS
ncbi:type II CAAX endopeptidase family protein [Lysinibacillus sp. KU-BSD001]|uniref:CPBP family intramembrane glutamic endopeptidase n=1 Tax=Lysinibacillus sp. KU-BSD001 TaxID=3141328 RepID=UPI0036E15033